MLASIVEARGVALRLDVAAALLALEPPLLGTEGRLGGAPRDRPHHGLAQYFEQAVDRIGPVALLCAEALGVDHDHAILGHALPGNPVQPQGRVFRQCDLARIETELSRSRELVDVLPARPGGADEADLDVVLVDRKVAGNPQHGVHRLDYARAIAQSL